VKCRCKSKIPMMEVGSTNHSASWGDVSDTTIVLYWCELCGRFLKVYRFIEDWYEPKRLEKHSKAKDKAIVSPTCKFKGCTNYDKKAKKYCCLGCSCDAACDAENQQKAKFYGRLPNSWGNKK
jgi:hypothetical protein